MIGMCFPSIGDERDIFTCSISFSNEWDIQFRSWPKQEVNETKKSDFLVPYWKWYTNGCVCSANGHVYSERLRLFWLNGCVYSWITCFGRMDVSSQWTDVSVWKGCALSNRTDVSVQKDCIFYNRKVSSDSYIKGKIPLQRKDQKHLGIHFLSSPLWIQGTCRQKFSSKFL